MFMGLNAQKEEIMKNQEGMHPVEVINDLYFSIHQLAALRFSNEKIRIVTSIKTPIETNERPDGTGWVIAGLKKEWMAEIYLGSGKWGDISGSGSTPVEALTQLHHGMLKAHTAVDDRRRDTERFAKTIVKHYL